MVAAALERMASARPVGRTGHIGTLAIVGIAILLAELLLTDLDHGTHLIVALLLVTGSAMLFGPGPAASGLTLGAGASVAVGGALVEGLLDSPHTYVQVFLYLIAGGAVIALASMAFRARVIEPRTVRAALGHGSTPAVPEPLTDREIEILRLAASGIAVDEMAARLYVSPNTVKTHLTHVYAKLGVRGRADAIRAALHAGCLTPADICPHRFPPEK
jgi:DNA-binding CsgD family transcriptional regulator